MLLENYSLEFQGKKLPVVHAIPAFKGSGNSLDWVKCNISRFKFAFNPVVKYAMVIIDQKPEKRNLTFYNYVDLPKEFHNIKMLISHFNNNVILNSNLLRLKDLNPGIIDGYEALENNLIRDFSEAEALAFMIYCMVHQRNSDWSAICKSRSKLIRKIFVGLGVKTFDILDADCQTISYFPNGTVTTIKPTKELFNKLQGYEIQLTRISEIEDQFSEYR
jgi:hypothetical protein